MTMEVPKQHKYFYVIFNSEKQPTKLYNVAGLEYILWYILIVSVIHENINSFHGNSYKSYDLSIQRYAFIFKFNFQVFSLKTLM